MTLSSILNKENLSRADLIDLLSITDPDERRQLHQAAYEVKAKYVGRIAYYRGLIEFSNRCIKNCLYCGIRRDNKSVERFDTDKKDILEMARWTHEHQYGSVTLQSGERQDDAFISYIEELVHDIKKLSHGELGITLCVGEQREETYRRWFEAGAHRYLLRIETSSPTLYKTLHPQDGHHVWQVRRDCLKTLKKIGYQTGTGVMIGLPGQSIADLADDIIFYRDTDIDMIGMGPYVVHHDTPLGQQVITSGNDDSESRLHRLNLSLNMIAATRLFLKDVNIASTTALQALHPLGREMGLQAGANILMPIVTLPKFRPQYQLYDNKPCVDENPDQCRGCLSRRVSVAGDTVGLGHWGDSPHYFRKHTR